MFRFYTDKDEILLIGVDFLFIFGFLILYDRSKI